MVAAAKQGDDDDALSFSDILGKKLLVGITEFDADEKLIGMIQYHGTVTRADENGITLRSEGLTKNGEDIDLPPILSAIEYGEPGEYQQKDTDEVVVDPDFTALFTVTRPRRH